MKSVSIVVPCFNESKGIVDFVKSIELLINSHPQYLFEVIFVDDGSSDNTFAALAELAIDYCWIKVVGLSRNFGKEAALTAGLDYATGDAVVFMDADLQHPPDIVRLFLKHWENGVLSVVGRRKNRDTDSRLYRLFADIFYRFHNAISDVKLPMNVGDFRLIDRRVADQLKELRESRRFMKGLFSWVGYEPVFVEYLVAPRSSGRSSFNKWRSWNFALEGITSFSTFPLRIWSYIGAFVFLSGLVYSAIVVFDSLINGIIVPGYATLLIGLVAFGGVQLIGLGILGEYIGRIYIEVKHRPPYIVSRVVGG